MSGSGLLPSRDGLSCIDRGYRRTRCGPRQCDACRSKTMIRVLYFSDAHIEIWQSDESHPWSETRPLGFGPDLRPFVGTVDLLVLAGDIGRIHSTRNVSPLSYAEQAAAFLGSQVILVPGNHEYYRGSFDEDRAALLTATNPGVVVLDRGGGGSRVFARAAGPGRHLMDRLRRHRRP